MYPKLHLGSLAISAFSLTLLTAFVVAGWLGAKQMQFLRLDASVAWRMLPWVAVSGVIGSRLYPVIEHLPAVFRGQFSLLNPGEVFYGGLVAGAVAATWRFRKFGLPLHWLFDYQIATVAFAHAIGRIGCFLVGDDYGLPTDSWVGMRFPNGSPPTTAGNLRAVGAYLSSSVSDATVVAVYPVQLFEAGAVFVFALVCWYASRRPHKPWSIFARYCFLYGCWRSVAEIFRAKADRIATGPLAGITIAQIISVALITVGLALWLRSRGSTVESSPPPLPPENARSATRQSALAS